MPSGLPGSKFFGNKKRHRRSPGIAQTICGQLLL
jgi:hypothetical protein